MRQHDRQTQTTHRDGEAPRVVADSREEVATRLLECPRRERYTPHARIDLVVSVPDEYEINAPRVVLDK
jgi:hypothetical protein